MKKFIPREQVEKAREMDLLTYLQRNEPNQLIERCGEYRMVEHDSLVISNGLWHWTSQHMGGRSALDFLIKVRGMSLPDAVEQIMGITSAPPESRPSRPPHREGKPFVLPPRNQDNTAVLNYLRSRGIQEDVLRYCVEKGFLYDSTHFHNAVFVGMDYDTPVPRYAFCRGTWDRKSSPTFRGDVEGSKKEYCFRLEGLDTRSLHIFEAAIEVLSYASLLSLKREDWHKCSMLSLGGVAGGNAIALREWLRHHPETTTIVLHLNNDEKGWYAAKRIPQSLPPTIHCIDCPPPPQDNDVNDYLCRYLRHRKGSVQK